MFTATSKKNFFESLHILHVCFASFFFLYQPYCMLLFFIIAILLLRMFCHITSLFHQDGTIFVGYKKTCVLPFHCICNLLLSKTTCLTLLVQVMNLPQDLFT